MKEALGVDIGGVLIPRIFENSFTTLRANRDNYLSIQPILNAFETLRLLNNLRFKGDIFLVSKCGERVEEKTREWLKYWNICNVTGIREENFNFCRKHSDKAGIADDLGLTHFIDDRLQVLGSLTTVGHLYLFNPRIDEVHGYGQHLPSVSTVYTWREVFRQILR